ncbi:type II secretion system minor pseudopilin GspK [Anaerobaca lacustris]|uniref:Type II secretion system minor pseudopilin GspK n=1 Tax=Anaerobaca lacustris TaxID=3044600 RepID=A0AAW6TVR1_9BACT|nr:type II secretion system minor pseudopilin GspK [Sedimentisphaerales bacterium M17dextr]
MSLRACRHRRNGFVLIVVLGMVVLLAALLFAFHRTTLASLEMAESFRQSERALNYARAGLSLAIAAIADTNDVTGDPRYAGLRAGEETFPIGDGRFEVTVTDESGRLNLNSLLDKNGQLNRRRIDQLLRLIDLLNRRKEAARIGYGVVAAVIDWIDPDDDVTVLSFVDSGGRGAESEYYQTLSPAYRCKNGPMDTIEELQWVKGVTPEAFAALRDLLTTTGSGRININAAPPLVIESLSEHMDATLARMIVQRRQVKPFETVAELRDVPGMTDNIFLAVKEAIEVKPKNACYRVTSRGRVEDRTCEIEALVQRNTGAGNVDILLYRQSN